MGGGEGGPCGWNWPSPCQQGGIYQALTTIVATHSMHAECSFIIVMAEYRNNGMGLLCPLGVSVWAGTELAMKRR